MNEYIVKPQQGLFDIAIEVYGDVRGVVWLVQDNGLMGATDPLGVGQKLKIRGGVINGRVVNYLSDFAPFQTINEATDVPQGIGFWKTEGYLIG